MNFCRLGFTLATATSLSGLPPVDSDGRRATLTGHGFGDSILNSTQELFVEYAIEQTHAVENTPDKKPVVLDIGGGWGDVAFEILQGGGNVIYIDMSEDQKKIVEEEYEKIHPELLKKFPHNALMESYDGRLPYSEDWQVRQASLLFSELTRAKSKYDFRGTAHFSTLMYQSGSEIERSLRWDHDNLEPGGRVYITGITAFSNLFPGYEAQHLEKLEQFRADPEKYPFPGWHPRVAESLKDHIPPN